MQWHVKLFENGYRLVDENDRPFGEWYQEQIRTPEWKSALIVYEKYKRKLNLEHNDLIQLREWLIEFSKDRKAQGKKCSNDFLTQVASNELKLRFRVNASGSNDNNLNSGIQE